MVTKRETVVALTQELCSGGRLRLRADFSYSDHSIVQSPDYAEFLSEDGVVRFPGLEREVTLDQRKAREKEERESDVVIIVKPGKNQASGVVRLLKVMVQNEFKLEDIVLVGEKHRAELQGDID